ncbi:hypothetical protein H5410_007207 [Solanum commersonii]|uniref:Uncharacterized protein n=1 Tax=Solanum commersonii TaxID=4109 RepID=A0A9J6ABF9_SOLCO|nr:hypothetical protein H5410_007207 [Solanum commersonii]
MIEDGFKTGKTTSYTSSQFANRAYQTSSFGKKKEKKVMMLMTRGVTSYNRQPHSCYLGFFRRFSEIPSSDISRLDKLVIQKAKEHQDGKAKPT